MTNAPDDRSVRAAFQKILAADRSGGRSRTRSQYQKLFAGFEDVIADELERAGAAPAPAEVAPRPPVERAEPGDDPPEWIGSYRILGVLGEGGMGTVFLAEQREPVRRRVALKVIKLGMDSKQVLARFEAERQALAIMNHDSIARVFEAGTTERGQPYFVMEHVEGVPITDYCDEHRLSLVQRIALFQSVCAGVQHAHHKGVIHRDLKPGNVLVTRREERAVPKIIDFGLARATNQQLVDQTLFTEQGQIIGTPEYMSPEQASFDAQSIDARTDIYSLGVMLYELLSGQLPFTSAELRAAGLLEIQRTIREVQPPKPSTRVSTVQSGSDESGAERRASTHDWVRELRGDLDWIVLKAMAKEPERRYDSAAGLALDLGRFLEHQPVLAGPPGAAYRARKFVRRYRVQVAAASVVLLSVVAGLIGTIGYAVAAEHQAELARNNSDRADKEANKAREEREKADEARLRAEAREAEALRTQSLFLADLASQHTSAGDATTGMLLALEALPSDLEDPERPYVHEVEAQLLRALVDRRERTTLLHDHQVTGVEFAPDGERFVTATRDGPARLWERSGDELASMGVESEALGAAGRAAWSPDGSRILTWQGDEASLEVRLWDRDGELVGALWHAKHAEFDADASRVLLSPGRTSRYQIRVYDRDAVPRGVLGWRTDEIHRRDDRYSASEGFGMSIRTPRDLRRGPPGLEFSHAVFDRQGAHVLTAPYPSAESTDVRLWDARWTELATFVPEATPDFVAFMAGGRRIFARSQGAGTAWLWRRDGDEVATTSDLAYGPWCVGEQRAVLTGADGVVRLWNVEDGTTRVLPSAGAARFAAMVGDEDEFLTATEDGTARLWSADGEELGVLGGHTGPIRDVELSSRGIVLTTSDDGTARLWTRDGRPLGVLGGHDAPVLDGAFSPDGSLAVTVAGRLAKVWDVEPPEVTVLGEPGRIVHAVFAMDGESVALVDDEMRVEIRALDGSVLPESPDGSSAPRFEPVNRSYTAGGQFGASDHFIRCYTTLNSIGDRALRLLSDRGMMVRLTDEEGEPAGEFKGGAGAFSPDGTRVVSTRVLSTRDGERIRDLAKAARFGAFSGDGEWLVTAAGSSADLWTSQGEPVAQLEGHESSVSLVGFSPNGELVLTAAFGNYQFQESGDVRLWTKTGEPRAVIPANLVRDAVIGPQNARVLTGSHDGTATLWDARGNVVASIQAHDRPVCVVAFSADGRRYLTGADDGVTRIWQRDGELLLAILGDGSRVDGASFSPDGAHVLVLAGQTAKLVPVPELQSLVDRARSVAGRWLTPEQRERAYLPEDPVARVVQDAVAEHVLHEDVRAALADRTDLLERERVRALRMLDGMEPPSVVGLHLSAYGTAASPDSTPAECERAVRQVRAALRLEPESANLAHTLAAALEAAGRPGEAREARSRALELARASSGKALGFGSAPISEYTARRTGLAIDETLVVRRVTPGSMADCAGLRESDLILSVDGTPASSERIAAAKEAADFFDPISLGVRRRGRGIDLRVTIGAADPPRPAPTAPFVPPPRHDVPANGAVVAGPGVRLEVTDGMTRGAAFRSTRWQVRAEGDSYDRSPTVDRFVWFRLEAPTIPPGRLSPATTYYWRAAMQQSGTRTTFSEETSFVTAAFPRTFVPFDLGPHLDADVVANAGDDSTDSLDAGGWSLVAEGLAGSLQDGSDDRALPADRRVSVHRLADYSTDNCIQLSRSDLAAVRIDVPDGRYSALRLLLTGGDGTSWLPLRIEYAEGDPDVVTVVCPDWYSDPEDLLDPALAPVLNGLDRISPDGLDPAGDPALFDFLLETDGGRTLTAIELRPTAEAFVSERTRLNLFAVTGVEDR